MGDESDTQRLNRELIELLNELRVALPGVQVLFAFLLAVPFQQRFSLVTPFQKNVYYATLCCAFVASVLLIAPSALHRLNFRAHDKERIVHTGNLLAIAGIGVLGLAMTGVVMLISDVLFGATATIVSTIVASILLTLLWGLLPLSLRRRLSP